MISKKNIRMFAIAIVAMAAPVTETQAQRFRGATFGGRSYGHATYGFRAGSAGYGRGSWRSLPGYSYSRLPSYGFGAYQPYRYGFARTDHDFRRLYGFAYYPTWYGYPFLWGYGSGYLDPGEAGPLWPAPSPAEDPGGMPAWGYSGGSTPAFVGQLQWPLGLRILPGADSHRQRIDQLYKTAAAQALAGTHNRQLPSQIKSAVKELERLVARDKHERLTLSSTMYAEAEAFLRDLKTNSP